MSFEGMPSALLRLRHSLHQQPCWLMGYGNCYGRITAQHLISRGLTVKSPAARRACERLLVPVCLHHNTSKAADAAWARRILTKRLAEVVGEDWLRTFIDAIEWRKPEARLSYADIMNGPEPPATGS